MVAARRAARAGWLSLTDLCPSPPARTQVEDGVRELQRAERSQKSGRAMTCIVVLCVLIAIFLLITIIRHT